MRIYSILFVAVLIPMSCGCGKPAVTWHGLYPGMKTKELNGRTVGNLWGDPKTGKGLSCMGVYTKSTNRGRVSISTNELARLYILDGRVASITFHFKPGDRVELDYVEEIEYDPDVSGSDKVVDYHTRGIRLGDGLIKRTPGE